MTVRVTVGAPLSPLAAALVAAAPLVGAEGLQSCDVYRVYHLDFDGARTQIERLCAEVLVDPVVEQVWIGTEPPRLGHSIEVAPLAGVTDIEARELESAARQLGLKNLRAATARRYDLQGNLNNETAALLSRRLLVNETIEQWSIGSLPAVFPSRISVPTEVVAVPLRGQDDRDLAELSKARVLSLDTHEMRAIQEHFGSLARHPTDAELETLAQTWSEHCVHKTFTAEIELLHSKADGQRIVSRHKSLLEELRQATEALNPWWLRSAFVDDAGIVAFDDDFDLAFKVETHNHPSALEPFGGANTGIGGVVRDVLAVSARPIACTNVLCFGPEDLSDERMPSGVHHPRRMREGVVAGIADYGNKLGLPTLNGAVVYHEGYTANPLVYCGALGLLRHGKHRNSAQVGDRVVCIGGRVGRDGIHGATFSSANMDTTTVDTVGAAVQIGDPITEKGCIEVVERACEAGLYNAITDCGAGGLSSAVGEMGKHLGVDIHLEGLPLKYPGLQPWEIWLSEAQERMVLAVPVAALGALRELCADWDVELTDLGSFTGSNDLVVRHGDHTVINMSMDFLHHGLPRRKMSAIWVDPLPSMVSTPGLDDALLLEFLAHPDIASKEDIVRRYDHEVRGGSVVRPYVGQHGDGPADAAVIKPLTSADTTQAVVLSNGLCPRVGVHDPYAMALLALDEAVRNLVAVGGDPNRVALLDNFCWGDPTKSDRLGGLVRAVQGCVEGTRRYAMPFISGKDSLFNEYEGRAIPGTLLISALGVVPDLHRAINSAQMRVGDDLWLVGWGSGALGGSVADALYALGATQVPSPLADPLPRYRRVHTLIMSGLVSSAHDCSDGGLAVALAEMAIGARCGLAVTVPTDGEDAFTAFFNEGPGRLVLSAPRHNRDALAASLGRFGRLIGAATADEVISIAASNDHAERRTPVMSIGLDEAVLAFTKRIG